MITLQNVLERFNILRNNKSILVAIAFLALIALAFYQFPVAKDRAFSVLSSTALSIFHSDTLSRNTAMDSELSTGDIDLAGSSNGEISAGEGWVIRKSAKGDNVWRVYAEMTRGNNDIILKNQTINGLKNLTILRNNIPGESVQNNSLKEGSDYSFLSRESVANYARKLSEANKQMQEGKMLKDLSQDLQTAYLLANAPSYQFLTTLQPGNLNLLN